jgi:thioredoxin-related protein
MRILSALVLCVLLSSYTTIWGTDFDKAKLQASTEHKFIVLNFSGSDWCGPCIRLHKEILDSDVFLSYADKNLVLVNADFPRQKKNQLAKVQQQQNDKLADRYNSKGNFPLTVLLSADGKLMKEWEGYPKMTIDEFVADIKNTIESHK